MLDLDEAMRSDFEEKLIVMRHESFEQIKSGEIEVKKKGDVN